MSAEIIEWIFLTMPTPSRRHSELGVAAISFYYEPCSGEGLL
jgi:hypothetical protein